MSKTLDIAQFGHIAGRRNLVINGNFDIWQRGTSFVNSNSYNADRWRVGRNGTTGDISRQAFAADQTDVPGAPIYFHRTVVTSGGTAGNHFTLQHRIENARHLAGQTAAISFWAKADAPKKLLVELWRDYGSTGSTGEYLPNPVMLDLSATWQKFTVFIDVPSLAGKTIGGGDDWIGVLFWYDSGSDNDPRTGGMPLQSGTFDLAQVQVEAGKVATPFEIRNVGEELALCQRYFEKSYDLETPIGTATYRGVTEGNDYSVSRTMHCSTMFKTRKRGVPTVVIYSPNNGASNRFYQVHGAHGAGNRKVNGLGVSECGLDRISCDISLSNDANNLFAWHYTADAEI